MSDKPKFTIGNGKHVFSLTDAYFADKDGNRIEMPEKINVTPESKDGDQEPFVFEMPQPTSFTTIFTDRATFNKLLLIIDPREWARRNWWKLPALWERKR